ncbi:MAG: hypothetical protein ACE1ZI_01170, partial [Acidobacteriota bacterium]
DGEGKRFGILSYGESLVLRGVQIHDARGFGLSKTASSRLDLGSVALATNITVFMEVSTKAGRGAQPCAQKPLFVNGL